MRKHLAAAALSLAAGSSAHAGIVYWANANLSVPANLNGLVINVETRATGTTAAAVPGWDLNPYNTGAITWLNASGTGMLRYPGVTTGSAGRLAFNTIVGSSGSYGSGSVVFGTSAGNWALGSSNYFGFRFTASDGLTHYGWGRMDVGSSANTRTIAELAYNDVAGAPISVGMTSTGPSAVTLTFEGAGNLVQLGNFYNGEAGGSLGVTFSPGTLSLVDWDVGGNGNFANEPSPSTVMFSLNFDSIVVNVSGGFSGFNAYFSTISAHGTWQVYSGLNGTGSLLASGYTWALGYGPGDPTGAYGYWEQIGASFSTTAQSLKLTGPANYIGYDNLHFETCSPSIAPTILNYPHTQTALAGTSCTAPMANFTSGVNAIDNCTPTSSLQITQSVPVGTPMPIGSHPVSITVRDLDGNSTVVTATFVVVETTHPTTYYRDADNDGYGTPLVTVVVCGLPPAGYVADNRDCNDADPSLNPQTIWFRDTDGDGLGATADGITSQCLQPSGFARIDGDNCPSVANADQADTNFNLLGDACELARGDLNLDEIVNGSDVPLLMNMWGQVNSPIGDLNHDGIVDAHDFAELLIHWGSRP